MNIEEAKRHCKNFVDENKDRPIILHEAIETVLSELDKKDKIINDEIIDTIVGDKKVLAVICKRIINKSENECTGQNLLCDDCILDYLTKKVEGK